MNPGRHPRYSRPSVTVPLAVAVVLPIALMSGADPAMLGSVVIAGLAAHAVVCVVLAARAAHGRPRRAWATLAAALGTWGVGGAFWAIHMLLLGRQPAPSSADFFFLAFTVLAAAAMVQFPVMATGQSRVRLMLDGATIALSLFLLAWLLVLKPVFSEPAEDKGAFSLAILYSAGGVVAVSLAIGALVRSRPRQRLVMGLLALAIALATAAYSAVSYLFVDGRNSVAALIDTGMAISLVAFTAAARLSDQPAKPEKPAAAVPASSSLWLPWVPLLLLGTVGPALVMSGLESVLVPVVMVVVCARQIVSAWENRRLLSAAADQALRDPLTGLANRTLFHDRLDHALRLRSRDDRSVAVVSLDLDDFKLVNDSLGHPAADSLLVQVGRRLTRCVRPGDTVARLGGDEFALLLEGLGDDSHLVAQRVMEVFNYPFHVEDTDMLVRPSIGMAVALDEDQVLSAETLIRRADIAMYAAKRSRSPEVHTFHTEMELTDPEAVDIVDNAGRPSGDGAAQVRLLGELRDAIEHHALSVVYQPKIDLSTGRVVGVEALLRWPHPHLGTLRPDTFLPLVRQHGLMRPVTDLAVDTVLTDAADWAAHGIHLPVAVNLFAPLLRDPQLPDTLLSALHTRGLPPDILTVEITEDLVLSEVHVVTAVLRQLRHRGIRVAIDDFGSGYSALSYLRDLPIDEIKLDRHFIANVTNDTKAAAVVSAVIDLTHTLDITVVAEGIEDADTAAWLTRHHCDTAQGYHFGKPTTAERISELAAFTAGNPLPIPGSDDTRQGTKLS